MPLPIILFITALIAIVIIAGFMMKNDWLTKTGLIFMAHSSFDRVAGYGLKYSDSFDHTLLGWIGKSKQRNAEERIAIEKANGVSGQV